MAGKDVTIARYPRADVVVCEGTLFACHLAWRVRQEGREVALATSGVSLFREAVDLMRPWADEAAWAAVPEPFGKALRAVVRETRGGKSYLNMVKVAVAVEDILLSSGVRLYYGARPAAVLKGYGRVSGVVLGGKFGLAAIESGCVVDATPDATVARLAGAKFERTGKKLAEVAYVVHSRQVRDAGEIALGNGHLRYHERFLEFDLKMKSPKTGPLEYARRFGDIHGAILAANRKLARRHPAFEMDTFRGANAYISSPLDRVAAGAGAANVLVAGPCGEVAGWDELGAQKDSTWAFRARPELADSIVGKVRSASGDARDDPGTSVRADAVIYSAPAAATRPETGLSYHFADPAYADPSSAPVKATLAFDLTADTAELVVAGGGTSGLPAAIYAAKAGVKTLCLESFGESGGANTTGGVSKIWFGRWPPAVDRHYLPVFRRAEKEKIHSALVMFDLTRASRARIAFSSPVCGVAKKGKKLAKVFVLTPHGMVSVSAKQFIDATGDGDLAAWAGAPYVYGTERDDITLWYSFGTFHHAQDEASRHFLTVADQRSMADLARAAVAARRQVGVFGHGEFPSYYLIPRESRHVVGDETVTYLDVLLGRRRDDVVTVAESNIDIKGMSSSDLALAGFVEQNYNDVHACHIPYGALLPRGLDNVLVTGRAYSISHDALSMARMQADMAALGMAAGAAGGLVKKTRKDFRRLPVRTLQGKLVSAGVLLPRDLLRGDGVGETLSGDALAVMIKRQATGPLTLDEQAGILSNSKQARPLLEPEVREGNYYGIEPISRMLCLMGSKAGTDYLLGRLEKALGGKELPSGAASPHNAPDHGLAPEPTYWINALAQAGENRLVPLLLTVAEKVNPDRNVADARFYYLHSIAYAAERLADPACIPALKRALEYPAFKNLSLPRGSDPRPAKDYVGERYAYLKLCLGRALARCGDKDGMEILARFTGDMRTFLARSAWLELKELTGADAGFDPAAWEAQIRASGCRPMPFVRKLS